ncbi:hypothetical protein MMC32_006908 [Xylographa parallela]|nr:hypothetical protein [Xylographa parallela]
MVNFNEIPPEIRLRIYSYVLLSEQTVVPLVAGGASGENILRSHYETALFTVNMKISDESLSYFYSRNAFVAVETNMTRFLSECCRAIPMNFGHCKTQFGGIVLKLQFYQFVGHASMRYTRCAFAVFSRRYLRNFIRLFEVNHSPIRQWSSKDSVTRMDLIFKTTGGYFKDNPVIKSSLVNDIKMLRGFPEATENHIALTFHSVLSRPDVLAQTGEIEETKRLIPKGDQFYQLGDYDAARGEYLIALSMATVPSQSGFEETTLETMDLLYIELRSKISVLDSEQKRYSSATIEAGKALELPDDRGLAPIVPTLRHIELYIRWATTMADNGHFESALEVLTTSCPFGLEHPALRRKVEEVQLLQKGHEAP